MADSGPPAARPRTLILLIAVLCWEAGRGIEALVLPTRSASYQFFRAMAVTPVHFALETLAVAVALAALGYLWRARPGWAQSALVALGYFAVHAAVVTAYMLAAPDRAREAFVAGRAARGQLADPERVAAVFALGFLEWRLVMSLTFYAAAAWLAWRHRAYVGPDEPGRSRRA